MSASLNQSSPVAKTAFDSLQAKQSALSLGYSPLVVRNAGTYRDLLQRATSDGTLRRQTPLVNAGYASRVLAVSQAIDGFVQFYGHVCPTITIQIVFLGCGVDVIGLWARSLCKESNELRIVELDMPDVCKAKKDFLISKGLILQAAENSETTDETLIGHIAPMTESTSTPDYFLAPVDLRNVLDMEQLLERGVILNPSTVPTLAVSELVLAYLPPGKTDQLLSWSASKLLAKAGSAMLVLEPLGYEEVSESLGVSTSPINVSEGYRREYCALFQNKMVRGKSSTAKNDEGADVLVDELSFFPIGSSIKSVKERFHLAEFGTIHVSSLGAAAAHASKGTEFRIPEVFDEHAALVLHLQSYVVVTAFSNSSNGLLSRFMCPASFVACEIPPKLTETVVYTVMERQDEDAMRNLFHSTYTDLFEPYPAIRKMVNGIMKKEFAISTEGAESEITGRYKAEGGCFFVAVRYPNGTLTSEREVVGCVGVRRCERKDDPGTLEVFRLAVHQDSRGQGIGRQLLQMVETFARTKQGRKLIANTLTCLESALVAYEACGYLCEMDSPLGYLTMRTYFKTLTQ